MCVNLERIHGARSENQVHRHQIVGREAQRYARAILALAVQVVGDPADPATDIGPVIDADAKGLATRAASGKVLGALAATLPELWGGSADLAESNLTTITGGGAQVPDGSPSSGP